MLPTPLPPTVLANSVVRLEPMEARHLEGLAAIAGDPAIWAWMGMDASQPGMIDVLVRQAIGGREAGREMPYVVHLADSGRIVGSSRYSNLEPADGGLEIGWTWYARDV